MPQPALNSYIISSAKSSALCCPLGEMKCLTAGRFQVLSSIVLLILASLGKRLLTRSEGGHGATRLRVRGRDAAPTLAFLLRPPPHSNK